MFFRPFLALSWLDPATIKASEMGFTSSYCWRFCLILIQRIKYALVMSSMIMNFAALTEFGVSSKDMTSIRFFLFDNISWRSGVKDE
jgi:hypothetical protein